MPFGGTGTRITRSRSAEFSTTRLGSWYGPALNDLGSNDIKFTKALERKIFDGTLGAEACSKRGAQTLLAVISDSSQNNCERWYAIRVQARFESLASEVLLGKGYESFLPVYKSVRQWSDRKKTLELPLFPGYLFCRFNPADRMLPIISKRLVNRVPIRPQVVYGRSSNCVRGGEGLPVFRQQFTETGDRVRRDP